MSKLYKSDLPGLLQPHIQGGLILSPTRVKGGGWGCTCQECPWVPPRWKRKELGNHVLLNTKITEADYVRTMEINEKTGEKKYCNLQFPVRCRKCSTEWKRYLRMRRRLNAIWAASWDFFGCDYQVIDENGVLECDEKCPCDKCRIYSRPKLITFALPSKNSEDYEDRDEQISTLSKKMKKALKILRTNGILGGTFVIECTSRLTELSEGFLNWKHHAHVHMVALAPKVPLAALPEFCEQLLPIGLGRINYIAPTNRKEVAGYISKYITKSKVHSRTFGVMRGTPGRLI